MYRDRSTDRFVHSRMRTWCRHDSQQASACKPFASCTHFRILLIPLSSSSPATCMPHSVLALPSLFVSPCSAFMHLDHSLLNLQHDKQGWDLWIWGIWHGTKAAAVHSTLASLLDLHGSNSGTWQAWFHNRKRNQQMQGTFNLSYAAHSS